MVKSNILCQSKKFPFLPIKISLIDSDIEDFDMECLVDTGARDYGVIIFDKDFDESQINQVPIKQFIPLAGSKYSLWGNQYICSIVFNDESYLTTIIIVRENIDESHRKRNIENSPRM